ncbi:MAG: polysaccharide deacetylase family protein [Chitinophagaceae bacterium]|nr:polysaccharide deacetylase family protein [Chitinophagaceae bacterium]
MKKNNMPPIVALHYVSDDPGLDSLKPWVVTHASYNMLLDYLEDNGYTTIGFEDVKLGNVPKKSVILTFDDCAKQLLDYAIPELVRRNMKAVFYMPTARIDGINHWDAKHGLPELGIMNEKDLQDIVAVGMEVGSHAHYHIMLEEHSGNRVKEELSKSKAILEKVLNRPVISIAYPFSSVPSDYNVLVKAAGYDFGIAVVANKETRYALRRWIFDDTDTIDSIKWKMSALYGLYRPFKDNYDFYKTALARGIYQQYSRLKKMLLNKALVLYALDSAIGIDAMDIAACCEVI